MTSWTFTSESVTEGHPDKMADQISDAVLDALLAEDPKSRVACETFVTTGLAIVGGEITTKGYVDIPGVVRATINSIGYNRESYGYDGATVGVMVALDEQSPDIAQGVDDSEEVRSGTSGEDLLNKQGAGDQGMMFGYACDETDELMPLPIHLAHRMAERLAEVRRAGTVPYLRPDGKTQVTFDYEDGKPVRLRTVLISTQHNDGVERDEVIKPDLIEHVIRPCVPGAVRRRRLRRVREPDRSLRHRWPGRRRRSDRPQDHRRHLRRHGPPRRRCVLGQGPVQGRPLGRLRRPLGRQERGGRRRGRPVRDPGRVRHRRRAAGLDHGRDLRHRERRARPRSPTPCARCSTSARPRSSRDLDLRRPIYRKTAAYGHFGRNDPDFTWERHRSSRRAEVGARALSDASCRGNGTRVVRVLPDRPGINKTVRLLGPRRAERTRPAWATWCGSTCTADESAAGSWPTTSSPRRVSRSKPIAKFSSVGPTAELIELADWAAWRWAGAPAHFLRTASPPAQRARPR